jgi:hypothetical protein
MLTNKRYGAKCGGFFWGFPQSVQGFLKERHFFKKLYVICAVYAGNGFRSVETVPPVTLR